MANGITRMSAKTGVLLLTGCLAVGAALPPDLVRDVDRKLSIESPAQVVTELSSSGDWDRLVAQIAAGNTGAIRLVRRLSEGTDAGTSEDLTISLAEALPKATGEVLLMLSPDRQSILSFEKVCSAPFIEDTRDHQHRYKLSALKAVRATYRTDPNLTLPGEYCIATLKKISA